MMTKKRILIITALFLLVLTGIRMAWVATSMPSERPLAAEGVLDLRGVSLDGPIFLDGEWMFYPDRFLMRESGASTAGGVSVALPGSWKGSFDDPDRTIGYGSFRLLVRLGDSAERELAVAMPSSVSASELFVNGVKLGAAGTPGTTAEETDAFEGPYTVSFTADGPEAEIVIHVANFGNAFAGGLLGSVQFGTEDEVVGHKQFSIAMQLFVCVVLIIHVIYALILYFIGARHRAVLLLALLMVGASLTVLVTDDQLLVTWLKLPYEISMRLFTLSYLWAAALLILFVQRLYPNLQKRPWHIYYGAITAGLTVAVALMPTAYVPLVDQATLPILLAGFLYVPVITWRAMLTVESDAMFLWLGSVALVFNLSWGMMNLFTPDFRSLHFYPLDLIVVFFSFASYWFRLYFRSSQQTARLAAELQKADKQKNDFLANTSHELRNPLHGMINIARSVLEEQSVHPAGKEKLELLVTVGRRMSILLNDLMDYDRLQGKGLRLEPKAVRAQAAAAGVIDMMGFMMEGKAVELRNEIPESFPPILADENRLVQILFNLLHNALKFTTEGHVTIRGVIRGESATLEVEDTGIGIEPGDLERLFRPYEQVDSSLTAIGGGIGLGLSISRQLAELHGGTLKAESEPGRGSTFRLTLPLAPESGRTDAATYPVEIRWQTPLANADSEALPGPGQIAAAAEYGERMPRVLVVDDDPVNLRILQGMLPGNRYEVATAYSGHEALELIAGGEWDLVVADVMMPRMSGYELTRNIRRRFSMSELPVLLLTARSQPEDIAAGFQAGANDYVVKPADMLELQYRVRALTELKLTAGERLRMEAAWLQAQVQPHFLFNTLNSIAALSEIDTARMRSLLDVFGKYLQASFDFRNSERVVPLGRELELVRAYLYIERERFEERLRVRWEVPENLLSPLIPPLSVQTVVENAVRHGVLKRTEGGTVRIEARDNGDHVAIRVSDDGVGIEKRILTNMLEDRPGRAGGIGLLNTNRRLQQIYGRGLDIASVPGQGTTVTIRAGKP
ncbi:hybrid sensor histidine kinase/response regulator [Cohnella massiliensis]|uniref:hybrid sensor histidine kinase/response regulator n=1 Tax=Cohnella massiliensis TaxID=1816691 RepID=UPI0009BB6B23|nr:ATP-binding protein [Cohnella massiliensis]